MENRSKAPIMVAMKLGVMRNLVIMFSSHVRFFPLVLAPQFDFESNLHYFHILCAIFLNICMITPMSFKNMKTSTHAII